MPETCVGYQTNEIRAICHGGSISPLHNATFKSLLSIELHDIAVRRSLQPLVCGSMFLAMEETAPYMATGYVIK